MGIKWLLISNAVLLGIFIVIPICRNLALYIFEKLSDTRKSKMISIMIFFGFLLIALALIFAIPGNGEEKSIKPMFSINNQKSIFVLPDNTNKISPDYFSDRESLESIHFYGENAEIDVATFAGCSNLKSVILPQKIKTIKPLTFAYCTELNSINIPKSVNEIGNGAFLHCTNLTEIKIQGDIGEEVFSGCSNLSKVTIAGNVRRIPDRAFQNCEKLTNISLPSSITTIGRSAFSGCKSLESIKIPSSVIFIGDEAFKDCQSLKVDYQKGSYAEQWFNSNRGGN